MSVLASTAAVDLGSNSTRLLIAEGRPDGTLHPLDRTSTVTRMAQDVDQLGVITGDAIARVLDALDRYAARITERGVQQTTAVLTSAARDASNGAHLAAMLSERYGWNAQIIDGQREAELTYTGATAAGSTSAEDLVAVVDIGGGSTEFVLGRGTQVLASISTPVGVVRHSERHLHHDPPTPDELAALEADVEQTFSAAVATLGTERPHRVIGVAGTATQSAAIDLALPQHDPSRVHGHTLDVATLDLLRARVAAVGLDERKAIVGLHPDRAATIVPGVLMLASAVRALGVDRVEVSEHDILEGIIRSHRDAFPGHASTY